jgi:hypothetical protein
MNWKTILWLAAATVAAGPAAFGAPLIQRSGDTNAQCCEFSAYVIAWTQATQWNNVQIQVLMNNNGSNPEPNTGVFLLLNSIGPGTTEAANEIGDAVIQVSGPGQHWVTPFNGFNLGPGTYYLLYYVASHAFNDYVGLALDTTPANLPVLGPGITVLPSMNEDPFDKAAYRPASPYLPLTGTSFLVNITGTPVGEPTPVPEPSTMGVMAAVAVAFGVRQVRRRFQ